MAIKALIRTHKYWIFETRYDEIPDKIAMSELMASSPIEESVDMPDKEKYDAAYQLNYITKFYERIVPAGQGGSELEAARP